MRSTLKTLEAAVIDAARRFVIDWTAEAAALDLEAAVQDLDAHLDELSAKRGAHNFRQTSITAADLSVPMIGHVRRRIIDAVYARGFSPIDGAPINSGMTDSELEYKLKRSHQTVSSARNWLVEAGWLRDSGFTRNTPTGRAAMVWILTDAARSKIASEEWTKEGIG